MPQAGLQAGKGAVWLSLVSVYPLSALSQELSLPPRTHVSKVPVRVCLCPGPLCPLPWPGEANLRPTHPGSSVDTTDQATWQFWLQLDRPTA